MKNHGRAGSAPSAAFIRIYNRIFKWLAILTTNWLGIYIVLRILKFT